MKKRKNYTGAIFEEVIAENLVNLTKKHLPTHPKTWNRINRGKLYLSTWYENAQNQRKLSLKRKLRALDTGRTELNTKNKDLKKIKNKILLQRVEKMALMKG